MLYILCPGQEHSVEYIIAGRVRVGVDALAHEDIGSRGGHDAGQDEQAKKGQKEFHGVSTEGILPLFLCSFKKKVVNKKKSMCC